MLKKLNPKKRELEIEKQNEIYKNIEEGTSFVFESGAGSGKTYALVETIKYLIENHHDTLKYFNQKIVVITFTNVAAKEAMKRLGHSNVVSISTIHDWISSWIFRYRSELLDIHVDKINNEISQIKNKLKQDKRYSELNEEEGRALIEIMYKDKNRDLFYIYYNALAQPSREAYKILDLPESISENLMSNMNDFKRIVNNLYKIKDLESALNKIKEKEEGYTRIEYNTNINYNRLEKLEIGHDGLLDYAKELIERHELLKRIIVSKYPFIFIDEYQDTDPLVVEIMKILHEYSENNQIDFQVGYFGDAMQNIYSSGIGDRLDKTHTNLNKISKMLIAALQPK